MKHYDYLIVGSGLFGSVFAYEAAKHGKTCLVLEKRSHTGGNVHCETIDDIVVHQYGAHIFHTNSKKIWTYVNKLADFNRYTNSPMANYHGELYNMPFNMNTFNQMWGTATPAEAKAKITEQRREIIGEPRNLEEQAISLVGRDIYEKLIKGYTEKQWGHDCKDLPAFIINRLPVRFIYDNNYFNDRYQGIPIGGYNVLIDKMLKKADVMTDTDFFSAPRKFRSMANTVIYTGTVDSYFKYRFGKLEYRSLRFETEHLPEENHQGVAVVNYTDRETPYTRIIEHKHFESGTQPTTVITKEYPVTWEDGMEPYYPLNNQENQTLYARYARLAAEEPNTFFGGRLAEYKYYDMDKVIESALNLCRQLFR